MHGVGGGHGGGAQYIMVSPSTFQTSSNLPSALGVFGSELCAMDLRIYFSFNICWSWCFVECEGEVGVHSLHEATRARMRQREVVPRAARAAHGR